MLTQAQVLKQTTFAGIRAIASEGAAQVDCSENAQTLYKIAGDYATKQVNAGYDSSPVPLDLEPKLKLANEMLDRAHIACGFVVQPQPTTSTRVSAFAWLAAGALLGFFWR